MMVAFSFSTNIYPVETAADFRVAQALHQAAGAPFLDDLERLSLTVEVTMRFAGVHKEQYINSSKNGIDRDYAKNTYYKQVNHAH